MSAGFAKCERGYELCSGPTEHVEDAHGYAAANDLFPDGAHACAGDCYGCGNSSQGCSGTQLKDLEDRQDRLNPYQCQTSDLARAQTGSIQSKSCTTRRSSTLKKQALLHERNVPKLVRTQKGIDRLTSVISAMEQSKYNELKFIYPAWYISVQGAFGRCGDERGFAGIMKERLRFIFYRFRKARAEETR